MHVTEPITQAIWW